MADGNNGARRGQESELGRILEDLCSLTGEVDAGCVVSGEGRVLASTLEHMAGVSADQERLGAMISALSGISERRARERGYEGYAQIRVRAREGYVLLTSLSGGATLAAATGPEARAGLVLYDMRNARPEVERALSGINGGGGVE